MINIKQYSLSTISLSSFVPQAYKPCLYACGTKSWNCGKKSDDG